MTAPRGNSLPPNIFLLLLLSVSCCLATVSSPQRCGHISVPSHYSISSLAPEAGGKLQDLSATVRLSADTGDLFCQCSSSSEASTSTQLQLSVFLIHKHGGDTYLMNFTLILPCQQVACVSWDSTHLPATMVVPSTARLILHGGKFAECGTFNQLLKFQLSAMNGPLVRVDVKELIHDDCIKVVNQSHQICQLQITSQYYHHPLPTNNVPPPTINITQTLPFNIQSCLRGPLVQPLSLLPLHHDKKASSQESSNQPIAHHPRTANNTDHNVNIHDLNILDQQQQQHHQRWIRQVNTMPRFESLHQISTVVENSDVGTIVDTITAVDTDEGTNGMLRYFLEPTAEQSRGLFMIDSSSGVVMTTGTIDREDWARHEFRLRAHDGGGLTSIITYVIEVIDENDNVPTFQEGSYFNRTVPETFQVSQTMGVLTVSVIDEDSGSNGMIDYTLVNNIDTRFGVSTNGMQVSIILLQQLDYETINHYQLTLIARDRGAPQQSSSATIDIHVQDEADSRPVFNGSSYSITVPEDIPPTTYLLTVYANSSDSPHLVSFKYIIISGDTSSRFSLNVGSGQLTLRQDLDYEDVVLYTLTIRAQSNINTLLRTDVTVEIAVSNVNDHTPMFTRTSYLISVQETERSNQVVTRVTAEDGDDGVFGLVSYQFRGGTSEQILTTFDLNSNTGEITARTPLDREDMATYTFTVIARDGGSPPRSSDVIVTIHVTDVNDEAPMFDQSEYHATVEENSSAGTMVTMVSATDSDSDGTTVTYFISSGDVGNAFSVGESDGIITTRIRLDRESRAFYRLEVTASDSLMETSVFVYVNVTDVNDQYPSFTQSLYSPPPVSELLIEGKQIINVTAIDRDEGSNSHVTYSSVDLDSKFSLDSDSGRISLASSLDYETTQSYSFMIIATDGGTPSRTATAVVDIRVRDENDNAPVFSPHEITASVEENQPPQTGIIQLTATDADSGTNAAVSYSIVGDARAIQVFGISPFGQVYTLRRLDREVMSQYQVVVQATDGGAEPLSRTVSITINIQDQIDYPPVFSQISYSVFITMVTMQGSRLVTVSASTRDNVVVNEILYTITSGANSTLFRINQLTGTIHAIININPVTHAGVYNLRVTAQHEHLSESVPVVITIMKDDGIPRLQPLTLYFNSLNTQLEATNYLGMVRVIQPRDNVNYTYSLEPSSSIVQRYFRIAMTTGELSVLRSVVSSHYRLNVSVTTATGTGYGLVDVYIRVLKNDTLRNSVIVTFGGVREASFMSIQLEQFAYSLTQIVPCSREQVEVFGIQRNGQENEEMVSVAFSVLQPDYLSYISQDSLLHLLQANMSNVRPSTLLGFGSEICASEPCSNLQHCTPVVELYRHSPASHLRTITVNNRLYLSHPFSQSYSCSCPNGFNLNDLCTSEINECQPSPCLFGAPCTDLVGDYSCDCPVGLSGKNCSIVCPSHSCQPCSPNPCLHDSECTIPNSDPSSFVCGACPWSPSNQGERCELTTLHFTTGSFIAFPTLGKLANVKLSLEFATVSPSGILLYNGRIGGGRDYITVELVIGQLSVGVSLGGGATVVKTSSLWILNDGEWHTVDIAVRDELLLVNVSGCSHDSQYLEGAEESCQLQTSLSDTTQYRILDLTTPLYIGGLEAHLSTLTNTVSSTSYDGCIANVRVEGSLLDFASPLRGYGTDIGCSPLEGACSRTQCGEGMECVRVWNGTVCQCVGGASCQVASSVQLNSGFLKMVQDTGPITVIAFKIDLRTRSSNAVLVQFGYHASLELRYGSMVYRRRHNATLGYTALTLAANSFINDGLWHRVSLELGHTTTKLSIDDGRITSSLPEGGVVEVAFVTLGAQESLITSSSHFTGCLKDLVINSAPFNLAETLSTGRDYFTVMSQHVLTGCGNGNLCDNINDIGCPGNSMCESGWQEYSCVCRGGFRVRDNGCFNPCNPSPCRNGASCSVLPPTSPDTFQCGCTNPFHGPTCEEITGETCSTGFYSRPSSSITSCHHCPCDPQGVSERVCDSNSGECSCQNDLDVYSATGELGCKSCDCHMTGSTSSQCNMDTGQCVCKENVAGRRCDHCAERYTGMDDLGCVAATVVYGQFSLAAVSFHRAMEEDGSDEFRELTATLEVELEKELFSFALPGLFEVVVTGLENSYGLVQVQYRVANYLPRGSQLVTRPSIYTLISVLQTIVQTGWVGLHRTNDSSHSVPIMCSLVPTVCEGCPDGTVKDGVICRSVIPPGCHGNDIDRDGIPASCDNCPTTFNPDQNTLACVISEGVCPGGVVSGVLWSPTSPGIADKKPCPNPLSGYVSRLCQQGGVWEDVDNSTCLSITGQTLLITAQAIESGHNLLSLEQLGSAVVQLEELVNRDSDQLTGGDVHVSGRLLEGYVQLLVSHMRSGAMRDGAVAVLDNIADTASNLLNPELSSQWVGVVEGVEFESYDFLSTIERVTSTVPGVLGMLSNSLDKENLVIKTWDLTNGDLETIRISLRGRTAHLSLPDELATPTSHVAMAMVANLGQWLPERYTFDVMNVTVATPLLSVQVINEGHVVEVTELTTPINITLQYRDVVHRTEHVQNAMCVAWEYGESGGWSLAGCNTTDVNHTHCSCQCSHLTVFSVLVPTIVFEPVEPPITGYHPEIFTYVVLSAVVLLLLVCVLVLTCLRTIQDLHNTVHKNLLSALMVSTLVFLVGIDRTEEEAVCSLFGVLLLYLLLASLSWMVADALIIGRFLITPSPKSNFTIYLIIIGWVLPLLLCGIPTGAVGIIRSSFVEDFGHPEYCWLASEVVWAFVAPAVLLLLLYLIGVLFSVVTLSKMTKSTNDTTLVGVAMNKHKIIMALCVSVATVVLFVITWSFGLLTVYLHSTLSQQYLDYPFAIFQATFATFLFIVLCLNSKVKDGFLTSLHRRKDMDLDISLQSTLNSSSTGHGSFTHRGAPTNQKHYNAQQRGFHNEMSQMAVQHDSSSSLATPTSTTPHLTHHSRTGEQETPLMRIARLPSHPPPVPLSHPPPLPSSHPPPSTTHRNQSTMSVPREVDPQPWFAVPDPTPLSPLTSGSDADSEHSYGSPDHSKVSHDQDAVSHDKRDLASDEKTLHDLVPIQMSHDQETGSYDHHRYVSRDRPKVKNNSRSKVSNSDQEDIDVAPAIPARTKIESDREGVSPSLSELYQQARGSMSPEGFLEYPKRSTPLHSPRGPLEKTGTEDPLWYCPRDSVQLDKPSPYETAVKTPSSLHLAAKWEGRGEIESPPTLKLAKEDGRNSNTSFSSSKHSSSHSGLGSSNSAMSSPPSSQRQPRSSGGGSPAMVVAPVQKKLSYPLLTSSPHSSASSSSQFPPPPLSTTAGGAAGAAGSNSVPISKKRLASRTDSDSILRPLHHPPLHRMASGGSSSSHTTPPTSHVSMGASVLPSSLPTQGGRGQRSKKGGAPSEGSVDSYHSNGPSAEGKIIRHADGSETHQSLV